MPTSSTTTTRGPEQRQSAPAAGVHSKRLDACSEGRFRQKTADSVIRVLVLAICKSRQPTIPAKSGGFKDLRP
jgi:hypothetical protein